jgi:hypothetical protein
MIQILYFIKFMMIHEMFEVIINKKYFKCAKNVHYMIEGVNIHRLIWQ